MKQKLLLFLVAIFAIVLLQCVTAKAQTISTIAGTGSGGDTGDGGPATAAEISFPGGISFDPSGNLFFVDFGNNVIRKITTSGTISRVAGTGFSGFSGDGGPATAAEIDQPENIAFDAHGNMYIPDTYNGRVRKVDISGVITTIAGTGAWGFSGDGGAATAAKLDLPQWVAVDNAGNVYIADYGNNRIRKVDTAGIITTIAGISGSLVSIGTGNGGPATAAKFAQLNQITTDMVGDIYVSDNNQIRKIDATGTITLFAGTGTGGYSGDGGAATAAKLSVPGGVAFDASGDVYIADVGNNRVRMVNTSGVITTVVGTGTAGFSGDGGAATAAKINGTIDTRSDDSGNLYISDIDNNRIRKVTGMSVAPITGNTTVNITDTLYDATPGGIWTSSSPGVAYIDSSTGIITAITLNTDTITYTVGTQSVSKTIIVAKTTGAPLGTSCAPIADDCTRPTVSLPDTFKLCPGTSALIYPAYTFPSGWFVTSFSWTPASGVSPATGTYQLDSALFDAPTTCTAFTLDVHFEGPNLITNGTFPWSMWPTCSTYNCMESFYGNGCGAAGNGSGHIKLGGSWSDQNEACPNFDSHTSDGTTMLLVHSIAACCQTEDRQYFWGQVVTLCPGKPYVFSYWERNADDAINNPGDRPDIEAYVGDSGSGHTLEQGYIANAIKLDSGTKGGYNGCDPTWHQVIVNFTASSGQAYICLHEYFFNYLFGIDDIELHRLDEREASALVCPNLPPIDSITVSNNSPCVGSSVTFTVHGNSGDTIRYKVISPQTGTTYGIHKLTASTWTYTLSSTVAGTATFTIDSVTEVASPMCTFGTAVSLSVVFEQPTITPSVVQACKGSTTALMFYTATNSPNSYSIHWSSGALALGFVNVSSLSLSASPATITISSSAIPGTYTGTIIVTNANGCVDSTTLTVVIKSLPGTIVGSQVCLNQSITLTDTPSAGTWSVAPLTGTAIFTSPGVIKGTGVGTTTVTYTAPDGCTSSEVFTVEPLPNPGIITTSNGTFHFCGGGSNYILYESQLHGHWSSSNPSSLLITGTTDSPATCLVVAYNVGTSIITYTDTNAFGCINHVSDTIIVDTNAIAPITGILGVCPGSTTPLSDVVPGGKWYSSDPTIASVDSLSGVVSGVTSGLVTISYVLNNGCGIYTASVTVVVNMPPYITTHFKVACQALEDVRGHFGVVYFLSDTGGCIKVCDSSLVRYYANGNYGSVFTWAVTGGTIINNYGDSIDVLWPAAGVFSQIILYDSLPGCTGEQTLCMNIIQKPHSVFAVLPDLTPAVGPIEECMGSTVNFYDLSVADPTSPIVTWEWNFGDGTYSSQQNPSHIFNTTSSNDTVTLVTANACNCKDTFRVVFTITSAGPQIACPAAACQNDTVTYNAVMECGSYNWSVIGGTIIAGTSTPSVTVSWDGVSAVSGFGYVNLEQDCGSLCVDTATMRIPIILTTPVIEGPDTICAGQEYVYTLPLWPGTQYQWGLLGDPFAILGVKTDHIVTTDIAATGTYTLHAWFQNDIKLCGGNVDKQVFVIPSTTISGDLNPCQGSTQTYTLDEGPGSTFHWVLTDPSGGTTEGDETGYTLTTTFTGAAGQYMLTLTGAFCSNPVFINVRPTPGAITGISGRDTVCLNREYTYVAYNDAPGTIYNWTVTGGSVIPASGSGVVTVVWTSSGTKQLTVYRTSLLSPFCQGPSYTMDITQELINPHITGDTLPCSNAFRTYTANYTRGETYNWSISPNTAGSVVSGDHTPSVSVLWNNTATEQSVTITAIITKCDSTFTKTLHVNQQPTLLPAITGPTSPACAGDTLLFTASPGATSYIWNFGDGGGQVTTYTNTISHVFPVNGTTANAAYSVSVTLTADTTLFCPVSGTAIMEVDIKPSPIAYASTGYEDLIPSTISGTVTNDVAGLTYQWYFDGATIAGATDASYIGTAVGNYNFTVTASNGCSATSNVVPLFSNGEGAGCGGYADQRATTSCNTISLIGLSTFASPAWYAFTTPVGGLIVTGTYTAQATYDIPGIYLFKFTEDSGGCQMIGNLADTIGYIADFNYTVNCLTGATGTNNVVLMDHTAYLPFFTIDSIRWYKGSTYIGSGNNLTIVLPAPASYSITETVYASGPDGQTSCQTTRTVNTVQSLLTPNFTDSNFLSCERVPIFFTPTNTVGAVGYYWDFGDGTSSLLQSPQRTYTFGGFFDPEPRTVTLTVTDSVGCTASVSHDLGIFINEFLGSVSPGSQVVCSNETPILLSYSETGISFPVSYLWNTGATTSSISVDTSGAYWVTVTDIYQCQATYPLTPVEIGITHAPPAIITGQQTYCIGDVVSLSGYEGTGVLYKWLRIHGTDTVEISTSYSIADYSLPIGEYTYQLVLGAINPITGVDCWDTSAPYIVHVYGPSAAPDVTGPTVIDCPSYHLQLTASEPVSGTYNWSDGTYGATDDIFAGGPYQVWFTNQYGCISDTTAYVPLAPDYYFPYFPSGCYAICPGLLPLTLYGTPLSDTFYSWQWKRYGTTVEEGDGPMLPYTITEHGSYSWILDNGLCSQHSDHLHLSVDSSCITCSAKHETTATLTCTDDNPASYSLELILTIPTSNTTYNIGTNIGPVVPFSGMVTTAGTYTLTLTFTTLPVPPPDSLYVEITYTSPDQGECFQSTEVSIPECTWVSERTAPPSPTDSAVLVRSSNDNLPRAGVGSSLMVFPNPSSGDVNMTYDYGVGTYKQRALEIYNALGQRMQYTIAPDTRGNWKINTAGWADGTYVIRMEADGSNIQMQRLVVSH